MSGLPGAPTPAASGVRFPSPFQLKTPDQLCCAAKQTIPRSHGIRQIVLCDSLLRRRPVPEQQNETRQASGRFRLHRGIQTFPERALASQGRQRERKERREAPAPRIRFPANHLQNRKKPHRKRGALCHPGDPGLFSFEFRKRIQHPSDRFVCPYALLTHTQLSPTTTTTTTAALFADSTVEIRICHCASSFGGAWRIAIGGCGVVR